MEPFVPLYDSIVIQVNNIVIFQSMKGERVIAFKTVIT